MKAPHKPKPPPPPGLQGAQPSVGSMSVPTPLQTAPIMPKDYVPMSVTDMSKAPMPPLLGKAAESTLTIASRPMQPWTWSTSEAIQPEQTPRQNSSTLGAVAASSSTSLTPPGLSLGSQVQAPQTLGPKQPTSFSKYYTSVLLQLQCRHQVSQVVLQ